MSNSIENKLLRIPLVNKLVVFSKKVKLPGLNGLTLYELLELYIYGIVKGAFSYRAGSIAFSFFMALFPFALFILNLIPYIPLKNFQQDFLKFVEDSVPPTTYGAIELIILDIMNNSYKSLISTGVIMSIFLMANGVNAIIGGFESSYHITNSRNFIRQYIVAVGLSVVLSLSMIFSVAVYLVVEFLMQVDGVPLIGRIARTLFVIFMILVMVSILYKFGTKETKSMDFFSYGSIFTTVLVTLTSYGFGVYVLSFAKYNELYGSIGTLLVVMIYIWINCMILLLGFDLNATILKLKGKNLYISKKL